jgi:hypothetical protein
MVIHLIRCVVGELDITGLAVIRQFLNRKQDGHGQIHITLHDMDCIESVQLACTGTLKLPLA